MSKRKHSACVLFTLRAAAVFAHPKHVLPWSLRQRLDGRLWTDRTYRSKLLSAFIIGVLLQRYTRGFGVEDERVFPLGMERGVVTIEGPVARLHGQFLLFEALAHLDAVSDTMAVGND